MWKSATQAAGLVAKELQRVYGNFGPKAVFGGSYGWSSAGRFHHAQSQIHRFLNVLGGYVSSVNTYSSGAAMVIIPHVLGPYDHFDRKSVTWDAIERSTELVVAFGGMALKNTDVHGGGISAHIVPQKLNGARCALCPRQPAEGRFSRRVECTVAADRAGHRCHADARPCACAPQ